jgi:DNA-binding protein
MKLRPPSPALAVSVTAVVIACTGSAVAATVITSSQIRNGTIQGVDIKNTTINSSKLSKGVQNILNS